MAGLEADTSSYASPLPVAPLDVAKSAQQFQSNAINIDKQKLELMNTQFGLMNQELSTMIDDPSITKQQAAQRLNNFANTLKMPPEAVDHMMKELQAAPDVKSFSENALRRGMSVQERINQQYGTNKELNSGASIQSGVEAPASKGGGFTPATRLPVQPGPTQPTVNNQRTLPDGTPNPNYLQPGIVGASGPDAVIPVPRARPSLPAERPVSGPTGPTVQTGHSFSERFAGGPQIVTGAAPGTAAAIGAVSEQSGKDFASDLTRAKNLQSELYPAERALELVKSQGPKAFGPGTEGLNTIKSAIATWLPNVDQKTIDSVSEFEQTRKYLTQIARASGATGTNDQLAAAFEANPSVKLNSASIENVLKSVIALRKMQAAQTLMAVNQNVPKEQYSEWIAKNQNQFDARAFGVDMMDDKAKEKLYSSLKKDPKAYQKFEKTIQFAHDAELVGQ